MSEFNQSASESTPMGSWRSLASSGLSTLRSRISQSQVNSRSGTPTPTQQSWREWAGQKVKAAAAASARTAGVRAPDGSLSERIALFPGWAARRYNTNPQDSGSKDVDAFEVDVFVSGYASTHRAPEFASRSQRAFIRVAKGFAALPKIVADAAEDAIHPPLSRSTENLLASVQLPPRPNEMTSEDAELKALERQFQRVTTADDDDKSSDSSSVNEDMSKPPTTVISTGSPVVAPTYSPSEIRRFHANLEARLQPFWSSVLSSRSVRIRLYTSTQNPQLDYHGTSRNEQPNTPVADTCVSTGADGSFQARFRVKWEDMCQHPGALHVAFGNPLEEHNLLVVADLLPRPTTTQTAPSTPASNPQRAGEADSYFFPMKTPSSSVVATAKLEVALTHSPIRVISDIDDTIKFSSILSGARSVFTNVFVKELSETIIPGMGDWYTSMWSRGIRFHYVSNGPFELLPVINDFFQISHLPPGSIKLKSYAGRSIFNGLLSAPAARKRAGVEEILNAFPDSRFIMIGDTGEQDLELYADLAKDRPDQILGVFLRDADDSYQPLEDPTGINAIFAIPPANVTRPGSSTRTISASSIKAATRVPSLPPSSSTFGILESPEHFTSAPESYHSEELAPIPSSRRTTNTRSSTHSSHSYVPRPRRDTSTSMNSSVSSRSQTENSRMNFLTYREHPAYLRMSEVDRKRCDLQMRVYKARLLIPDTIPLRVFRDPRECEEAEEALAREGL